MKLFERKTSLETKFGTIRQGLATADDFRFLRLFPEVPLSPETRRFRPFAKGGAYSPYFGLPEVMVEWAEDGEVYWGGKVSKKTGKPSSNIWMLKETISRYFLTRGLTYTRRTNSAFAPRALPEGSVFADKGESVFCDRPEELPYVCGIMQTSPFQMLVEGFVANGDSVQSEGAARGYVGGIIKKLPLPVPDTEQLTQVTNACIELMLCHRERFFVDETCQLFISPFGDCHRLGESLAKTYLLLETDKLNTVVRALEASHRIEQVARVLYDISDSDRELIDGVIGRHPEEYPDEESPKELLALYAFTDEELLKELRERGITGRVYVNQCYHSSRKIEIISHMCRIRGSSVARQLKEQIPICRADLVEFCASVLSYCVGVRFGVWDASIVVDRKKVDLPPSPFSSLPTSSLGSLDSGDASSTNVSRPGVLVDDEGHPEDIVSGVRHVIATLWPASGDTILGEACDILAVKSTREYFRRASRGFGDEHIKRYSKGRRKAPVYWQLSTASASYSVWLYYHRLTKDVCFKVLDDFVKPKRDHERRKLDRLRAEAGAGPTQSQHKEIEDQEKFVAELAAMAEEVERIAPLWNPNLNDGVVINFSPLWRLVPHNKTWQKECKSCWYKLVNGDYDWTHLAMHLWPERVVPKCVTDASLAIAHGLEEVFWVQDDRERFQPKEEPEGGWTPVIEQLVKDRSSPAVKAALQSLLDAPVPSSSSGRSRRRRAGS